MVAQSFSPPHWAQGGTSEGVAMACKPVLKNSQGGPQKCAGTLSRALDSHCAALTMQLLGVCDHATAGEYCQPGAGHRGHHSLTIRHE
jgi:hypothetical protein